MSKNFVEPIPLVDENGLAADSAWLFPDYAFKSMNLVDFRGVIIERILERGTWKHVRWLYATYGEPEVASWVRKHGYRRLSKRSFALWRLTLGIKDYVAADWMVEAKKMEPW